MSDTLALLALMKKDEGLTEEQVNQVIDSKNLQPKLTAGENITISADNVISATDTGLTQEQVNTLIDSKNLQPKLTAGTNITIENNVISSTDTGLNETEVNTLIDSKTTSYNFKVGESNTDVGLRIVKDLWAGNWNKYNLTFNGEPVHKVFKDETNNQLVFTVLRANYQSPSGPLLVGRLINVLFENNEIVGYVVSGSNAGGNYIVGHTDAQINTLIDTKLGVIENGSY